MHFGFGGHGRGCGPRGPGRGPHGRDFDWEGCAQAAAGHRAGTAAGRGRRRVFDGAELRLLLLKLIADETRHGYELIRTIEQLTGGSYAPSPGVVYPTLSMLDEMGMIAEQRSDDSRKRFAITCAGEQHLADREAEVAELFARLEGMGGSQSRADGSPVWRAMRNLGMAVRNRVGHGDMSGDAAHDIAAMIDELARKVERS